MRLAQKNRLHQPDGRCNEKESDIGRILIVQYSSKYDGSAFSGLLLADGLRNAGWETHVAFGYAGPMEVEYQKSGHKTCVVEHNNWLRQSHPVRFLRDVLNEWQISSKFCGLLDQLHPHVVYINTAVSLAGAVAAKRKNVPCIWHLRELFKNVGGEMDAPAVAMPLVHYLFSRFSLQIISNSRAVAENLLGMRSANKAEVIPNAVEDVFFKNSAGQREARKNLGLPVTGKLIGVPGTLRPVKGHPFFFKAAAQLVERFPGIQVAISGSGEKEYVENLKKTVSDYGIEKNVMFLGSIYEMPFFYRACDVVCIPSRAEPFGRVVIEAFASGVPVVATAVGGILEIVDNNVDGVLVSYGDTNGLATAMGQLIKDKALRERLSQTALEKAKERYHEDIYKETLCRLVYSVMGL